MKLRRQESLLLILTSLILGMVTDALIRQQIFGLNFVVWSVLWNFIGVAAVLFKGKVTPRTGIYFVFILVNSALVYLRSEPIVVFWSVLLTLIFRALMYTSIMVKNYPEVTLLNRSLEFVAGYITAFFETFGVSAKALFSKQASSKPKSISVGALIAIPLVLIFIGLFSSSDTVFGNGFSWLGDVSSSLSDLFNNLDVTRINTILFWGLMAFGGLAMLVRSAYASQLPRTQLPKILNSKDTNIITGSVVAVFAIFAAVQVRYLFAGSALPDGISYADYARRGYGELLLATMLASAVVYLARTVTKKTSRAGYWLEFSLIALNALVVLSAWKRLSLYESAYGWTMTRFVARMGLICIMLGIISLAVWLKGKITTGRLFTVNWYSLALVLTMAAVLNPIGLITKRNILDVSSREVKLDTDHIILQSADSYPSICAYGNTLKERHFTEFKLLSERRMASESIEFTQTRKSRETTNEKVNAGLSAHYTESEQYIDKYKYCLHF